MDRLLAFLRRLRGPAGGPALGEYFVVLALVAATAIVVLLVFGNSVSEVLSTVSGSV